MFSPWTLTVFEKSQLLILRIFSGTNVRFGGFSRPLLYSKIETRKLIGYSEAHPEPDGPLESCMKPQIQ